MQTLKAIPRSLNSFVVKPNCKDTNMIHNKVKKIKKVLELKNPTTFSKHGPRSKYSYIKLDKYKSENLFALYTTSLGAIS